jgi:DNA-binding MarR family transcriptional regulator
MSLKAMTCAMALRGVTASEKLLLLALANYADEDGACFPSQARLAEDACLSLRTVVTLLAALEERGLIARERRTRRDGTRTSDAITLLFHGGLSATIAHPECNPPQSQRAMTAHLSTFEPVRRTIKADAPDKTDLSDAVWQEANQDSRNRSGRPAVRRAVTAAIAKGATPESLLSSVRAHCRRSGEHAKGVHRIIEAELWREAVPTRPKPTGAVDPAYRAHCERHYAATGEWKPEWGEKPRRAA